MHSFGGKKQGKRSIKYTTFKNWPPYGILQESTDVHSIIESKYSKPYDITHIFIKVNISVCVCQEWYL